MYVGVQLTLAPQLQQASNRAKDARLARALGPSSGPRALWAMGAGRGKERAREQREASGERRQGLEKSRRLHCRLSGVAKPRKWRDMSVERQRGSLFLLPFFRASNKLGACLVALGVGGEFSANSALLLIAQFRTLAGRLERQIKARSLSEGSLRGGCNSMLATSSLNDAQPSWPGGASERREPVARGGGARVARHARNTPGQLI